MLCVLFCAQARTLGAQQKHQVELDELEKELGLSSSVGSTAVDRSNGDPSIISPLDCGSELPINEGCIPENWIYSIFGPSLPLEQNCWIWDWLLTRGDKYAGNSIGLY